MLTSFIAGLSAGYWSHFNLRITQSEKGGVDLYPDHDTDLTREVDLRDSGPMSRPMLSATGVSWVMWFAILKS